MLHYGVGETTTTVIKEVSNLDSTGGAKMTKNQSVDKCQQCGNEGTVYKVKHAIKRMCFECRYEFNDNLANGEYEGWINND